MSKSFVPPPRDCSKRCITYLTHWGVKAEWKFSNLRLELDYSYQTWYLAKKGVKDFQSLLTEKQTAKLETAK